MRTAAEIAQSSEFDVAIGERVHLLMWREKLSQAQVAKELGIGQPALSRKLRGERPWAVAELYALTRILRQPLVELMGFEPMLSPDDRPGEEAGNSNDAQGVTPQYVPRNVRILGKNGTSGPRTSIRVNHRNIQ